MTVGDRLRRLREQQGQTQTELAERAGISRQLVGALETDRQLPRVDVALAVAAALGIDVRDLFGPESPALDVVTGLVPPDDTLFRVGLVGDRTVVDAVRAGDAGWDVADAVVEDGALHAMVTIRPGVVVAGCEPGLEVLERLLRERGVAALSVACSSAAAINALAGGRTHAAVVHADPTDLPEAPSAVARFHMCRWRVGLAGPAEADRAWFATALGARAPIVQREPGAAVQAVLERTIGMVQGPTVGTHLEAARLAVHTGTAAVTIEPAALSVGASFHPLETHAAQLWVGEEWLGLSAVETALAEMVGERFQQRLRGVGGYDLDGSGVRAA